MRLAILLPPLDGPAAGLAVYVGEIVPRLLARHPDWVLFTEQEGELPDWCRGAPVRRLAGGPVHALARRFTHRRLSRLGAVQITLRRDLGRQGARALLVPFHDGVFRSPVPQAIVVHDLTLLREPAAGAAPARVYMKTVFRPVARSADALIAVSEATARDLADWTAIGRERISVIHEGYDRSLFRPFDDQEIGTALARHGVEAPFLFYAGTFSPHKNLGTALAALSALAPTRPALGLVVAGPRGGSGFEAFRAEAHRAGLADRVRALGYVERRDLGPLMAGAAAFVFPSRREGFGLAVLEAMASGAAVLASDRASLPEVVGDGGRLLDPDRPEHWARAVGELLDDPGSSRRLRHAAAARATRFDWDDAAARILDLLIGLTREGSGRADHGGRRG